MEEAFFKQRDQQLMDKLRGELQSLEETKKLAHVSGIVQEHVLLNLVKAGIKAETLAAVTTIPMVEVAWCDGAVSAAEKAAVLNAAAKMGLHAGTAPYEVLEHWLVDRPDSRIVASWKEYVQELAKLMPQDTLEAMHKDVIDRCVRSCRGSWRLCGHPPHLEDRAGDDRRLRQRTQAVASQSRGRESIAVETIHLGESPPQLTPDPFTPAQPLRPAQSATGVRLFRIAPGCRDATRCQIACYGCRGIITSLSAAQCADATHRSPPAIGFGRCAARRGSARGLRDPGDRPDRPANFLGHDAAGRLRLAAPEARDSRSRTRDCRSAAAGLCSTRRCCPRDAAAAAGGRACRTGGANGSCHAGRLWPAADGRARQYAASRPGLRAGAGGLRRTRSATQDHTVANRRACQQ